jgi:hypothetical protein
VSTPEGVRPKVSNQGGSIDYLLIATLSLRAKREGSYVRIASSVQAILSRGCAVNRAVRTYEHVEYFGNIQ